MNSVSLPARIGYAVAALAVGGAVGFYAGIWLLPKLAAHMPGADADMDGFGVFKAAIGIGVGLGFTASLIALTLPWMRRRRRTGRTGRIVISCVFVVLASLGFAGQGHELVYDLLFAAWLAYVMAFTYVRYGVRDRAHRTGASGADSTSSDYIG
jgi:hypothetical protein